MNESLAQKRTYLLRRIFFGENLLKIQILRKFTYFLGSVAIAGARRRRSVTFDSFIDFSGGVSMH